MPRHNSKGRKLYTISLYKLQQELKLTTIQRVKVGKFVKEVLLTKI